MTLLRDLALHFTVYLHKGTSTDAQRTVFDGVYYTSKHLILEVWVKIVDCIPYQSNINFQSNMQLTSLYTWWHTLHTNCAYFSQKFDTWLQEYYECHFVLYFRLHLLVTIYSPCKQWMFIGTATEDSFMGKRNITQHSWNHNNTHYTHNCVCHTKLRYVIRNIFFSGKLHFTLQSCLPTSIYTDANKTCLSWCHLTYSYM
jgi:hypothetical protein